MNAFLIKLFLMVIWPFVAVIALVGSAILFVVMWFLIPFGTIQRDEKGKLEFKLTK